MFTQSRSPPALGFATDYVHPPFRRPRRAHALRQGRPALNFEPGDSQDRDPVERAAIMRRRFSNGTRGRRRLRWLPHLPAAWTAQVSPGWVSEIGRPGGRRPGFLVNRGDSPIGFRLPRSACRHLPAGELPAPSVPAPTQWAGAPGRVAWIHNPLSTESFWADRSEDAPPPSPKLGGARCFPPGQGASRAPAGRRPRLGSASHSVPRLTVEPPRNDGPLRCSCPRPSNGWKTIFEPPCPIVEATARRVPYPGPCLGA